MNPLTYTKQIRCIDGPCAGARYTSQYWPPDGTIDFFQPKDGAIEVVRYAIRWAGTEFEAVYLDSRVCDTTSEVTGSPSTAKPSS